MSENGHKSLLEALLDFQQNAPVLQKDATNPHFGNKYVSLDQITQTINPALHERGLLWHTTPSQDERGQPVLCYTLTHVPTGEAISADMPLLLAKNDPQGQGSAITYARRYAISAVLGLSAEDDDGQAASRGSRAPSSQPQSTAQARSGPRPASVAQRRLINAKAAEAGVTLETLANIVRVAMGEQVREYTEEQARGWLDRYMDRLPGSKVNAVLENIAAEAK